MKQLGILFNIVGPGRRAGLPGGRSRLGNHPSALAYGPPRQAQHPGLARLTRVVCTRWISCSFPWVGRRSPPDQHNYEIRSRAIPHTRVSTSGRVAPASHQNPLLVCRAQWATSREHGSVHPTELGHYPRPPPDNGTRCHVPRKRAHDNAARGTQCPPATNYTDAPTIVNAASRTHCTRACFHC